MMYALEQGGQGKADDVRVVAGILEYKSVLECGEGRGWSKHTIILRTSNIEAHQVYVCTVRACVRGMHRSKSRRRRSLISDAIVLSSSSCLLFLFLFLFLSPSFSLLSQNSSRGGIFTHIRVCQCICHPCSLQIFFLSGYIQLSDYRSKRGFTLFFLVSIRWKLKSECLKKFKTLVNMLQIRANLVNLDGLSRRHHFLDRHFDVVSVFSAIS